jgi:intraflagellar transport protein 172
MHQHPTIRPNVRLTQAIISHPNIAFDPALVAAAAAALSKAGLLEHVGDLAAHLGRPADALTAFKQARAYRKAVELARDAAPAQVRARLWDTRTASTRVPGVRSRACRGAGALLRQAPPTGTADACMNQVVALEEEWGDWLVSQRQMDAAVNHFIEAGVAAKAIEAALAARQFPKAAGVAGVSVAVTAKEPPSAILVSGT